MQAQGTMQVQDSEEEFIHPLEPLPAAIQACMLYNMRSIHLSQLAKRKLPFPFLKLPRELRNKIYHLAIDFGGISAWFDKYYDDLNEQAALAGDYIPGPDFRATPTVLLICKQITHEVRKEMRFHSITFDHGIFRCPSLQKVISPNFLRHLGSITINDGGNAYLSHWVPFETSTANMTILDGLAAVLAKPGHKVKHIEISIRDPYMVEHIAKCWSESSACGARDALMRGIEEMACSIRGIQTVVLEGIPEPDASYLKSRMMLQYPVWAIAPQFQFASETRHWATFELKP